MADEREENVEERKVDVARLETERDASRSAQPAANGIERRRDASAIVLAVIAALLIALSVPAVWLNRMVSDTDAYVATVAPLADDPDIQNAVAAAASDAIIERIDAANRIRQLLPEQLEMIAAPVAEAVNGFVERQALAFVRSDGFDEAWEAVNRASHEAFVAAVTGRDTGAVGAEAGVITLDVGVLADQVGDRLKIAGFDLAAGIPQGGIEKRIVLHESALLASLTGAVDAITRIAFWLPLLGVILAGAAVVVAAERRRAVLWLGGALAVGSVLPLQALFLSQTYAARQLYELAAIPTPAAQSAFAIIFRDLISADRATAALGLALWLGAISAGPARWAVASRTGIGGGLSGIASRLELGRFGTWVAARKSGLRWAGAGVVLVFLVALPAPRTVAGIVWLAGSFAAWILLVELFGASPPEPSDTAVSFESGDESSEE